ncbi:MAG TPA: hypothetical protein VM324_08630 [Egibacteraceae bacterium]|jgi:hypothetical protein|nr:hypothetical protein [Egibacteraceae bacterium]
MSNTIADELTPEELARYERVSSRHDELVARITDRTGDIGTVTDDLGTAAESTADVILYMLNALHESGDGDTAAPGQVVAFLDRLLGVLHDLRAEAVTESRRRADAAEEGGAS